MNIYLRAFGVVPLVAGIALLGWTGYKKYTDSDDMPWRLVIFLFFASLFFIGWGSAWLQGKRLRDLNNEEGAKNPDAPAANAAITSEEGQTPEPKPWEKGRR